MKVLFVASGNKKWEDSPIVKKQGDSLFKAGLDLDYFFIMGRGFYGYFKSFFLLRRLLGKKKYDIVHAHYSLSGFVASLAGTQTLVVSLMGSDVHRHGFYRLLIKYFNKWRWAALIVKSEEMKDVIGIDSAQVIPNGVDMDQFCPISQTEAKQKVSFKNKNIIFVGNPERPEKNYNLAKASISLLKDELVKLIVISHKPHEELPSYMNAADVLLLTSNYEGSPNVIKEAMACNCPIVATDVGDISRVFGNTDGCYLTSFDPENVAKNLSLALEFGRRTDGRERIRLLGLDADSIAERIASLYTLILSEEISV